VAGAGRELESFLTLLLADQAPELAAAHDELYPERVPEAIPLSLTLLYPFLPPASIGETELDELGTFFASRPAFSFGIARVAQSSEVALMEEFEPDRYRVRETFRLGA
jgi:hypothetical protein